MVSHSFDGFEIHIHLEEEDCTVSNPLSKLKELTEPSVLQVPYLNRYVGNLTNVRNLVRNRIGHARSAALCFEEEGEGFSLDMGFSLGNENSGYSVYLEEISNTDVVKAKEKNQKRLDALLKEEEDEEEEEEYSDEETAAPVESYQLENLVDIATCIDEAICYSLQSIPPPIAPLLGPKLAAMPKLRILECGSDEDTISAKELEIVCQILDQSNMLETLSFLGEFDDPGEAIFSLSESLRRNSTLRSLEFGLDCLLSDEELGNLISGLTTNKTLHSLTIRMKVEGGQNTVQRLSELLRSKESALESLALIGYYPLKAVLQSKWSLSHYVMKAEQWKKLSMDVSPIAFALSEGRHCLKQLDISWKTVSSASLLKMFDSLASNALSLEELSLQGVDMDPAAQLGLAQALKSNTRMVFLDVSHNEITLDCMEVLAGALTTNTPVLRTLLMEKCSISLEMVNLFAASLPNIKKLETLDLSFNNFGAEGAWALANGLRQNQSLMSLLMYNKKLPGICAGVDDRSVDDENAAKKAQGYLDLNRLSRIDLSKASKTQLDNVAGYLNCQRSLSNIAKREDPDDQLSTADLPSLALRKTNCDGQEVFNGDLRQMNIHGKPVSMVEELMEAAKVAKAIFDSMLFEMAERSGLTDLSNVKNAPLKSIDRIIEKASNDYSHRVPGPGVSWINDVCRGSILCATHEQMLGINAFIQDKLRTGDLQVVSWKNRFRNPTLSGYRDWLMVVRLPVKTDDGGGQFFFNCEIQVHLEPIWTTQKKLGSHKYYEFFRENFAGNDSEAVAGLMAFLEPIAESGVIDSSLIKAVIESSDIERMQKMAFLFRNFVPEPNIAITLRRRILELQQTLDDRGSIEAVETSIAIGDLWILLGNKQEAKSSYTIALSDYEKSEKDDFLLRLKIAVRLAEVDSGGGGVPPEVLKAAQLLGSANDELRRKDSVEIQLQRAKVLDIAADGWSRKGMEDTTLEVDDETISILDISVDTGGEKRMVDMALKAYEEALSIRCSVFGESHREVANSHFKIGQHYMGLNMLPKAIAELSTSLDMCRQQIGEIHTKTAKVSFALGQAHMLEKQYDKAVLQFENCANVRRLSLDGDHEDTVAALVGFGKALVHLGELAKAKETFVEIVSLEEERFGNHKLSRHPNLKFLHFINMKLEAS